VPRVGAIHPQPSPHGACGLAWRNDRAFEGWSSGFDGSVFENRRRGASPSRHFESLRFSTLLAFTRQVSRLLAHRRVQLPLTRGQPLLIQNGA